MNPDEVNGAARVLLRDIAVNLTVLEGLGVRVRLRHDAVITDAGYVLDAGDQEGWVARSLTYLPSTRPTRPERKPVWPQPSPPTAS